MRRIASIIVLTVLFAAGQVAHAEQNVFGQPLPPGCEMGTSFKGPYPQAYFLTTDPKQEVICTVGWLKNLAQFWHWLQALTVPEVTPKEK